MEGKLPPNQLCALKYKYITCHWKGKNRAHPKGEKKHKEEEMEGQFCYCGKVGKTTTSWTDSNPGRRFIGCERYGKDGACGFFVWVDPPMCARSRVVIPGLLRSIGRLEA
ncbi:uncharacterized protein LOC131311052 [Rhododendron vialii]|uniref:uncharacterized protein LOC131311052 n=1 Tax=Rhododendron vialii TaxID=182163 RepID=UPI00265E57E1|nr:uncharacterized protein LOC131311052 [Rhododendron vialii]